MLCSQGKGKQVEGKIISLMMILYEAEQNALAFFWFIITKD
jgi:hypothetical protein